MQEMTPRGPMIVTLRLGKKSLFFLDEKKFLDSYFALHVILGHCIKLCCAVLSVLIRTWRIIFIVRIN